MGAVLLSPLYIILNIYLAARILLWFSSLGGWAGSAWFAFLFAVLYTLTALTPLAGAFGRGRMKRHTKKISNYWLGVLMYLLIFLLLSDLIRIASCLISGRSLFSRVGEAIYLPGGAAVLLATAGFSIYGIVHAHRVRKVTYQASVQKNCSIAPSRATHTGMGGVSIPSIKIALVADLHLGYSIGLQEVEKIARLIRGMEPDLIVFAGDLFDNEYAAIQEPEKCAQVLASLTSTWGSWACWGNHDVEELIFAGFTFDSGDSVPGSPQMRQFLSDSHIRVLEDEVLLIDGAFYLVGRLDASCQKKSGQIRLTPAELTAGLDPEKPVIVIDPQPSQLQELADAGADLVLSGHTHDGQIFPANITTRIGWKNSRGKLCIGRMTSIVTSGAGVWGPAMRVGTCSEVVEVLVRCEAK